MGTETQPRTAHRSNRYLRSGMLGHRIRIYPLLRQRRQKRVDLYSEGHLNKCSQRLDETFAGIINGYPRLYNLETVRRKF